MDTSAALQIFLSLGILPVLFRTLWLYAQRPDYTGMGFAGICIIAGTKLGLHLHETHLFSLGSLVPYTAVSVMVISAFVQARIRLCARHGSIMPHVSGLFIVLITLAGLLPDPRVHDSFMMFHFSAALFFVSRPICLGLAILSFGFGLDNIRLWRRAYQKDEKSDRVAACMGHISHDFLVLALIVFLGGEISGSLWSFLGWGTTWRWSGTFFFSAMIFVFFLVGAHAPFKLTSHPVRRQWLSCTPVFLVILFLLTSKLS